MAIISEAVSEVLKPDPDDSSKDNTVNKMVTSLIDYECERIIDALAESMGKWMPTPDMPKPRVKKKAAKKTAKKQVKRKI